MNNTAATMFLLRIVKDALRGKTAEIRPEENIGKEDWESVLRLADRHLLLPVVYEVVFETESFQKAKAASPASFEIFQKSALRQVEGQYIRTAAFLDVYRFLESRNVRPLVAKGLICRWMYPDPEYRQSWDEDLLVSPDEFSVCHKALLDFGLVLMTPQKDFEKSHEILYKDYSSGLFLEVHRTLFPPESEAYGMLNRYFTDAFDRPVRKSFCSFEGSAEESVWTLAPQQHLLYLILHMFKHFLYFGAGIRQLTDILMFSKYYGPELDWELLRKQCCEVHAEVFVAGLFSIGERYLGFNADSVGIPRGWIEKAVEVDELLADLIDAGMQAQTSMSRIHSSTITLDAVAAEQSGHRNRMAVIRRILPTLDELRPRYSYLDKNPVLLPAAWIHRLFSYAKETKGQGDRNSPVESLRIGRERVELFRQQGILERKKEDTSAVFSKSIKTVGAGAFGGKLAPAASLIWKCVFGLEWQTLNLLWSLKGYHMPGPKEQRAVRDNVTFIYKSFERKEMAVGLYENIQRFYPGARVIIADDSRVPLRYDAPFLEVLNLPFNSGLSYGISRALERVRTPYVMRMDDDELLTRCTGVGKQLLFLHQHPEIDIVTFGFITVLNHYPEKVVWPEYYHQTMTEAPKRLKIRHMTRIDDTHTVLGKGPNIYLARTEGIRKVGYDENIRMIDHHEFFYRAAGVLVTVGALDSFVFHRHNPFDTAYQRYRADFRADQEYILEKIKKMTREQG